MVEHPYFEVRISYFKGKTPYFDVSSTSILRIKNELLFSALATTPLLARLVRTHGLLQMKSGWFELSLAETATSPVHPFKVPDLKRNPQFEKNLNWRKSAAQSQLGGADLSIGRSSAT